MIPWLQCLICLMLVHICGCQESRKDYAMSVVGLKSLINEQQEFISELTAYTTALRSKINTIERFLAEVRARKQMWSDNAEAYLENPLNSYSLVRRLHVDWSYFEAYMEATVGKTQIENVKRLIAEQAPQKQDLDDAMKALIRLQRYYDLDEDQLAQGLIDGKQYDSQLSALDCFAMAEYCRNISFNRNAVNWYKEAVDKYNYTKDGQLLEMVYGLTVVDFYGQYATALMVQGNNKEALNVLDKVADLHIQLWLQRRRLEDSSNHLQTGGQLFKEKPNNIQIGCHGQFKATTRMHCYYEDSNDKFLKLAPLKVELLSKEPFVALYHDVIYDDEIEELLYVNPDDMVHDRSVKFFNSRKEIIVDMDLNYRILHMTGNDVIGETEFLLINYGLGGHKKIHSDADSFDIKESPLNIPLKTIEFFLSEVTQGGATVFPELEITVMPKKGAALVWNNLDNRLNVDNRLDHLNCPVMVGSKWTLVKWIYK